MAEAARAPQRMTLAEFLEWDDGTDTRYELVDGVPMAMAPTGGKHSNMVGALTAQLFPQLRPPCRAPIGWGVAIPRKGNAHYIPDALIDCSGQVDGQHAPDPRLIVEILSPSTRGHDLAIKLPDYQTLASVLHILVIDPDERRAQLWSRDGARWVVESGIESGRIELPALSLSVDLDALWAVAEPVQPQSEGSGG